MQSTAKNVSEYLDQVPAERKAVLTKLRKLCRASLKGFEETMMYGMPVYARNGQAEVSFASQKNYIALYFLKKDVMDSHRDLLNVKGVNLGKGCIRYTKPEKIDFQVVEMMLKATRESASKICD